MSIEIMGTTRLTGLIGWPVEHSLSPAMHNAAYERLGLDWVYVPFGVGDEASLPVIVAALKALPVVGFNVTMPYKRRMLDLCDEVALQARLAGAVNTVHVRDGCLIGYNTDGRGLLESLAQEAHFVPEGRRAVVFGAGGAAGAAVMSLTLGCAASVTVAARRRSEAEEIVERIGAAGRDTRLDVVGMDASLEEAVKAADLVLNATPVGMEPGDPSPVPAEWLHQGQVVYDMIYNPAMTPLMAAARERGAVVCGGLGMLVSQGAISIDIWDEGVHVGAPRDVMRSAAERALYPTCPVPAPEGA
jgi:shikimate dehydrogenase